MLLIISWNINIPRQFNNQWNQINYGHSTKINVLQFSTPYFFLDVSSRFQYYLWLVDSADSQNMIDCDKPVVMFINVQTPFNDFHHALVP
jgi:hypothetical protein